MGTIECIIISSMAINALIFFGESIMLKNFKFFNYGITIFKSIENSTKKINLNNVPNIVTRFNNTVIKKEDNIIYFYSPITFIRREIRSFQMKGIMQIDNKSIKLRFKIFFGTIYLFISFIIYFILLTLNTENMPRYSIAIFIFMMIIMFCITTYIEIRVMSNIYQKIKKQYGIYTK